MFKIFILVSLSLFSVNLLASKARMEALHNSKLIFDSRSILSNPAQLNTISNFLVTELGTQDGAQTDSTSAPAAEAGFFLQGGAFNYGLYVGDQSDAMNDKRGTGFLKKENTIKMFLAGDAGILWGVKVGYASNKDEQTTAISKEQIAYDVGLGAVVGDMEIYGTIKLKDQSNGAASASDTWKAKIGGEVGAVLPLGEYSLIANLQKEGADQALGGVTSSYNMTSYSIGLGKLFVTTGTSRVIAEVDLTKVTNNGSSDPEELKVPFKAGFEVDATSWLVVRGSFSQVVWGVQTKDKKKKSYSGADGLDVAGGVGINLGKLKVDGLIGVNNHRSGTTVTSEKRGELTTLTRLGVTYIF